MAAANLAPLHQESNFNAGMDSVVIVGSDPFVLETASASVLVRWPHATLKSAKLGTKGLEMVEQDRPDLVVLSNVPDFRFHEFAKQHRTRSSVPLLVGIRPQCRAVPEVR